MTAETKPRVEGQDCGGPTEQARKQLIFLLPGWVVAGLASLSNDILWLCDWKVAQTYLSYYNLLSPVQRYTL